MSWFSRQLEDVGRVATDAGRAVADAVTPTFVDQVREDRYKVRQAQFVEDKNEMLRSLGAEVPKLVKPIEKMGVGELHDANVTSAKRLMEEDLKQYRADNAHLAPSDEEAIWREKNGMKPISDQVSRVFGTGPYAGLSRDELLATPEGALIREARKNSAITKTLFSPLRKALRVQGLEANEKALEARAERSAASHPRRLAAKLAVDKEVGMKNSLLDLDRVFGVLAEAQKRKQQASQFQRLALNPRGKKDIEREERASARLDAFLNEEDAETPQGMAARELARQLSEGVYGAEDKTWKGNAGYIPQSFY